MKKVYVYCIIILISLAPFFRGLFFAMESYIFMAAFSILFILYLLFKLRNSEPLFFSKWLLIPGGLLVFAHALSSIRAVNMNEHTYTLMQYLVYFLAALVICDYCCSENLKSFSSFMLPVAISGLICAIVGLGLMTGAFPMFRYTLSNNRLGSTFQYPNTAAVYFIVCIVFVLTIINVSNNIIARSLLIGVGNILMFAFFMTGSRGGYLAGVITILLYFLLQPLRAKAGTFIGFSAMLIPVFIAMRGYSRSISLQDSGEGAKWLFISFTVSVAAGLAVQFILGIFRKSGSKPARIVITAVCMILIAVSAAVVVKRISSILPQNLIIRIITFDLNNKSISARLEFYGDAIELIRENWLLGLGGGGWASLYQSVQERFYTARDVHNHYLQVFVEAGILGFLAYLSLVVFSVLNPLISFFKTRDDRYRMYLSGILCGFFSLAFHSVMDFDMSYTSIGLLFWMLIALSMSNLQSGTVKFSVQPHQGVLSGYRFSVLSICVLCSLMFSVAGLRATAALYAYEGLKCVRAGNYANAVTYYEEAGRLVPGDPSYQFEIAKLYNYFSPRARDPELRSQYRMKALAAAENSVRLDMYYPAYTEVLVYSYLEAGMPIDAAASAERLAGLQPCNKKVYELLARSYIEASEYCFAKNETEKALDYLRKCARIDPTASSGPSKKLLQYMEIAREMLSEYGI